MKKTTKKTSKEANALPPEEKKQEVKKKKSESKKEKTNTIQNLGSGILFLVIGGAMTLFAGYLLWQRVFTATDLEKVLPEKNLVFFANIEELDGIESLSEEQKEWDTRIKTFQNILFGMDLESTRNWRGDRGGVALYATDESPITFVEARRQKEAQAYLLSEQPSKRGEKDGYEIFSFLAPVEKHCAFLSDYLTCARSQQALENLIASIHADAAVIAANPEFEQVTAELPRNHIARIFLNTENLPENLPILEKYRAFAPFQKTLSSVGATVMEDAKDRKLEASMLFMREEVGEEKDISNEEIEFNGGVPELLSFLPQDTTGFIWGNDLAEDMMMGFASFREIDPGFEATLQSILNEQLDEIFDGELSWSLDILPLLEKEFAFGKTASGNFAIVRTGDAEFAAAKAEKIKKALEKMSARFVPRIISHTLQDGSVVREVFPNDEAVETSERTEDGAEIFTLTANDGEKDVLALEFLRQDDLLYLGPIPEEEGFAFLRKDPAILQNLPTEFAGASEEVFAFSPDVLKSLQFPAENIPQFVRGSGKIVNTPRFLRIQGALEL